MALFLVVLVYFGGFITLLFYGIRPALAMVRQAWTIQARHYPYSTGMSDASVMLNKVRTLKELLK